MRQQLIQILAQAPLQYKQKQLCILHMQVRLPPLRMQQLLPLHLMQFERMPVLRLQQPIIVGQLWGDSYRALHNLTLHDHL